MNKSVEKFLWSAVLTFIAISVFIACNFSFAMAADETQTTQQTTEETVTEPTITQVDEVKLNINTITVGLGESVTLKAQVNEGATTDSIVFSSYNQRVATVTQKGKFTAIATGKTVIYARARQGVYDKCIVTVLPAAPSVNLNATNLTIGVGESFDFNSWVDKGTASYYRKFAADDTSILSYQGSGIFKSLKVGTATVSVTLFNGKMAECTVKVLPAAQTVNLNATNLTLGVGESFDFNSWVEKGAASHYRKFAVSSNIMSYQGSGIFKAEKTGKATVSVTLFNGLRAECQVTILPMPQSISSKYQTYSVYTGSNRASYILCSKGTACNSFTYKSSDSSIAYCDSSGNIYGKKVGTAKITVTSANNKKCTFNVRVIRLNVPFVNQKPKYPTGCEAASCVQLMKYYGYDITLDEMVSLIPRKSIYYSGGKKYGPDINKYFAGNPASDYDDPDPGYGAFSPCVTKALQNAVNKKGGTHKAIDISGCSFETLVNHVYSGKPVIVWATYRMMKPVQVHSWYVDTTGKYFEYPRGTHVMVVSGFSEKAVAIVDPYAGVSAYSIELFRQRWELLGRQAIILK